MRVAGSVAGLVRRGVVEAGTGRIRADHMEEAGLDGAGLDGGLAGRQHLTCTDCLFVCLLIYPTE